MIDSFRIICRKYFELYAVSHYQPLFRKKRIIRTVNERKDNPIVKLKRKKGYIDIIQYRDKKILKIPKD